MSRIYRALEKAEEERRQRGREEPSLRLFEDKAPLMREQTILKFPEEIEEKGLLPAGEEGPLLIAPSHSFAEEEFRKLRTQIFLRLPNPPRSILITSAVPGEGKTMVSVNLALTISKEIQKKAILIDGDLRTPGIHLDKNQNGKGLSNYLLDGASLSEILINPEIDNLRVIMAGPSSSKASELIGSQKMEGLLKSLFESGDNTYILIDSPPITCTTEPTLLSKMVDGIIFVVRADRTPRELIQRAVKSLDRQKIIGVVLNQVQMKASGDYSNYYYRYGKK
jgi:capsular exopolysaccharide synthesis family protein